MHEEAQGEQQDEARHHVLPNQRPHRCARTVFFHPERENMLIVSRVAVLCATSSEVTTATDDAIRKYIEYMYLEGLRRTPSMDTVPAWMEVHADE
jgi:hypothetical protein